MDFVFNLLIIADFAQAFLDRFAGLQWQPLSMWSLWSGNRNLVNALRVLGLVIMVRYGSHTVTLCLINLYIYIYICSLSFSSAAYIGPLYCPSTFWCGAL